MSRNPLMDAPQYDPNKLFDTARDLLAVDTDLALSRVLDMSAPNLCHMRHHNIPVGPTVLVRLHEETGLSVIALRRLMGDRRSKFRSMALTKHERRRAYSSRQNREGD